MKQTAVEFLVEQLEQKGEASVNMSIGRMQISIIEEDYINLLEQAKEMEKQQQGYNEEEVKKLIVDFLFVKGIGKEVGSVNEWFEQNKNK